MPSLKSDPLLDATDKLRSAENLRQARNFAEARRLCEEILRTSPDYVAALNTLGLILIDQNENGNALAPLAKAAVLCPIDWKLFVTLGIANLNLRNSNSALLAFDQALKLHPDNPDILYLMGEAHRQDRDHAAAATAFQRCLALNPAAGEARRLLADSLCQVGQFGDAVTQFRQMVRDGKAGLTTLALLCNVPFKMVDFDAVAALEAAEKRKTTLAPERAAALSAFIRGWIFDGQGNHATAWKSLVAANEIKWRTSAADYAKDVVLRREQLAAARALPGGLGGAISDKGLATSLFILGPSRSGKTTLERLLGHLPQTERGHDVSIVEQAVREATQLGGAVTRNSLNALPTHLDKIFTGQYVAALGRRAKNARLFTNTHPDRLRDVARLSATVPNCRFVFLRRRVKDLTLRIFQKPEGSPYAYDLESIREYLTWYNDYISLLHARFSSTTLVLDYEAMIEDPRGALASVASLCGLTAPTPGVPALGDDRNCSWSYLDMMRATS